MPWHLPALRNGDLHLLRNGIHLRFVDEPYRQREDATMKSVIISFAAVLVVGLLAGSTSAEAKGCIKGAIVGGVAGSMAGHGKMGAAAGCAVGHHRANKKR